MCYRENSENMKLSRKPKRVSWAPALNLCQVKLFLSDDSPLKVGKPTEAHIQEKNSKLSRSTTSDESVSPPPGFGDHANVNPVILQACNIPRIHWKCPPKFVLSHNWLVAAGEESQETDSQKLRELRVLEAVYPHHSSTPDSPSVSFDIQQESYDDRLTSIVPLTPIEEATSDKINISAPLSSQISELPASCGSLNSMKFQTPIAPGLPDPRDDIMAIANVALAELTKSGAQGTLIDTDLLFKIFNDPKMIEKLLNGFAPANLATTVMADKSAPSSGSSQFQHPSKPWLNLNQQPNVKPSIISYPMPTHGCLQPLQGTVQPAIGCIPAQHTVEPVPRQVAQKLPVRLSSTSSKPNCVQAMLNTATSPWNTLLRSSPATVKLPNLATPALGMVPVKLDHVSQGLISSAKADTAKDITYFRNLIKEHGTEKTQTRDFAHEHRTEERKMHRPGALNNFNEHIGIRNIELEENIKLGEVKSEFQKQCKFFNSPKGCRRGTKCQFHHGLSSQRQTGHEPEFPVAKRMKMSTEFRKDIHV